MNLVFVNRTSAVKIPQKFLKDWVKDVSQQLVKHKILSARHKKWLKSEPELVLVSVSAAQMKKLNRQYRGKDNATDVLSFAGDMDSDFTAGLGSHEATLGELVLCLPVIQRQAKEHGLNFKQELGYMVLHGILHLLGYDHEGSRAEAARMFKLQDEIFAKLR